jgi:phosphoglycolate phosphatase-like HAD superfamily hydrolase
MDVFSAYDNIIFDLDGTLYDERDYLFECYRRIGADLEAAYPVKQAEIVAFLKDNFLLEGHTRLFNKLCHRWNLPSSVIDEAVGILRTIQIERPIPLFPHMQLLLASLIPKKRLFIVTNGNVLQQKNKVKQIQWGSALGQIPIVYANDLAPKPAPASFLQLKSEYGLTETSTIMVGDTETDAGFARNSGIAFLQVDQLKKT